MPQRMTIGALARAAGVNVETIRYYQRRGLLATPGRLSGYRTYGEEALNCIAFIRRGQSLGFTLDEIGTLLKVDATKDCETGRGLVERKLVEVHNRVLELSRMSRTLKSLAKAAAASRRGPCVVVRHLRGEDKA